MANAGKDVPALRNRPDPLGYGWLMQAFLQLSTCRSIGFSIGRIPWTATEEWARAHQLHVGEKWVLHEVIAAMDNVFIEYHQKKASKN